jgi:multidrug efflux pump subunit AcrB
MRWRRLAGLGVVAMSASLLAAFLLLPLAVRAFVRALQVTVNACVWLAASLSAGTDVWTIAGAIGRAAGEALATPRALAVIVALVLVGALALMGLQRLLGPERPERN